MQLIKLRNVLLKDADLSNIFDMARVIVPNLLGIIWILFKHFLKWQGIINITIISSTIYFYRRIDQWYYLIVRLGAYMYCKMVAFYIADAIFYQWVSYITYDDCYMNLYYGGIYRLINDYAYDNGLCKYKTMGGIYYYVKIIYPIILNALYHIRTHYILYTILLLIIIMDRLLFYLHKHKNTVPSVKQFCVFYLSQKKLPTLKQLQLIITIKLLSYYLTVDSMTKLIAELKLTYKVKKSKTSVLHALKKDLPLNMPYNGVGHRYYALCRGRVKNILKYLVKVKHDDYFDFGTKRDNKKGSSVVKSIGDFRYNVHAEIPKNKNLIMIDVSHHMDDYDYARLIMNNNVAYQYIPTPITELTLDAYLSDNDEIIYTQSVDNGDRFVNEKFRINRFETNCMLSTGYEDVVMINELLNIGDHHIVRRTAATAILPIGFFTLEKPKYTKVFGLIGYDETLVMTKDREDRSKFVIVPTDQFELMKTTTNYDRCSTINNSVNSLDANFRLTQFAKNSEMSDYIKTHGCQTSWFSLKSNWLRCVKLKNIKTKFNTEVRMEQPKILKKVISIDKEPSLVPSIPHDAEEITMSKCGPINGSIPSKNAHSTAHAFIQRYITKPSQCEIKSPSKFIKLAEEFVAQIYKRTGTLVPSKDYFKTKHKDVYDKTKHYSIKSRADQAVCGVFTKRETYTGKINYNRQISNQSQDLVAEFTPYTRAIHDSFAKNVHWYLPGKKNIPSTMTVNTVGLDFSSFEASQKLPFRIIELLLYKLFDKAHHKKFIDLMMDELRTVFKFNLKTKYKEKTRAKNPFDKHFLSALSKRLSGSAWTTLGNCSVAAFLLYLYYRSIGYTDDEAYEAIKAVYGDDVLIIDGHAEPFSRFVKKLGFQVTFECFKGPGQKSLLGKVITYDNGKQIDAVRTLSKFLIAYGKYNHDINIMNKWSGCYNPKLKESKSSNIFTMIGKEAYRRVNRLNKYVFNEYTSEVTDYNTNDTFEKAFQGEHDKLVYRYKDIKVGELSNEEFIREVSCLITPYISKILPVPGNKYGIICNRKDVYALTDKLFVIDLDEQKKKVKFFNEWVRHYHDYFGKHFKIVTEKLRMVLVGKYITNLVNLCKATSVTTMSSSIVKKYHIKKFNHVKTTKAKAKTFKTKGEVRIPYNSKQTKRYVIKAKSL
jgi:hypothetical protein